MRRCQRCQVENPAVARFCQACGASLAEPGRIVEERRLVSILFIDIVGSTELAHGADPEDVRDYLRAFSDTVRERIERFDGTVEKFIGDAVVAVFGAPVSHGDDAERAVRCGLDVLATIERRQAEAKDGEGVGPRIAVRAGIATGEAVVSLGTAFERGEALVTGDVANTAARLQAAAPVGRLIVGEATHAASRRAIAYEPSPPVTAKGKPEPLEAWLVVGPLAPLSPLDTAAGRGTLVGRDRELDLLRSVVERTAGERRPHLVTLLGPPGIGKSRLASGFLSQVETEVGTVLIGRSLPYEERAGYRATAEQLRSLAGILEDDEGRIARGKLETAVTELLPAEEVADVTRNLSLLLGLGVDGPTEDRLQLFFAFRRVVEALGARPTVLVFEDLHWAGASQLDLVEYLATHVRDVPVVFLSLARPELATSWQAWGGGLLAQTTIPLEPLAEADAAAYVRDLLGDGRDDEAVTRLVETADGNPLFLEELAASLKERADDQLVLPATVREAIDARIDLLPAEQRTALLDASVIGRTFWRGVLGSISEDPALLDEVLDALEIRDLIRRVPASQVAGDREYSFKHALIRDAAYAVIPRAVRRVRHAAVADYVEGAVPEPREFAWLLAHHRREAGERDAAVGYLLVAADRALQAWAKSEANGLFAEALTLIGDDEPERARSIRLRRAIANVNVGELDDAAAELRELLPHLTGREEIEASIELARCATWLEEVAEARQASDRARALAEAAGDDELMPAAIGFQGATRIAEGDVVAATALCDEALSIWVPGSRPHDLTQVMEWQSENRYWTGDYADAESLARDSLDLSGRTFSLDRQLRGGGWHGLTLAALGRTEEAIEALDAVVERMTEAGEPRWGASALNYSSMPFRDLFMVDEARRRNEASLELTLRHGEWGMPELQGKIDLLVEDLMEGAVGRAQTAWPEIWDAAINGRAWRPWLGGIRLSLVRAEIARQAEGPEATIEWATDAHRRAIEGHRPKYQADATELLGGALVGLGRGEEGVGHLEEACAIADRLGTPTARWRIRASLGWARYAVGDDDGAETAFTEASGIIGAFASTLSPPHAATFLAAEPVATVLETSGAG